MEIDEHTDNDRPMPLSPIARPLPVDHELLESQSSVGRHRRHSIDQDADYQLPGPHPTIAKNRASASGSRRISSAVRPSLPLNMLPSAPASPPTPAPSPTPFQRQPSWLEANPDEEALLKDTRTRFALLDEGGKQRFLAEMLNICSSNMLSFVSAFVSPRLKKDPFEHLPDELCLRVNHTLDHFRLLVLTDSGPWIY